MARKHHSAMCRAPGKNRTAPAVEFGYILTGRRQRGLNQGFVMYCNVMWVWSLRWHFTNRSVTVVTGAPYLNIKVTVCHIAGHCGEEYDDWNSAVFRSRRNCSSDDAKPCRFGNNRGRKWKQSRYGVGELSKSFSHAWAVTQPLINFRRRRIGTPRTERLEVR